MYTKLCRNLYVTGTVCVRICVCALISGSKGSEFLHPSPTGKLFPELFEVRYTSGVQVYGSGLQWLVTTSEKKYFPHYSCQGLAGFGLHMQVIS